ncbi:MAG TPA: nuclear transport factor 2 family protein [Polyangia bacterium]|jgi:uncharacterized protein (TIGR02246 family)
MIEVTESARAPVPIAEIVRQFVDGFNTNSLDDVMAFFADDAVYEPGDGRTHRGRAAIRETFRPQFEHAFGTMRFVVNDQVVDERARKAVIRWVCQHDFSTMKSTLQRWLFKALYGRRAGWYGTDIFHFDQRGKIIGKFSYANYGRRPHVRRDLGDPAAVAPR